MRGVIEERVCQHWHTALDSAEGSKLIASAGGAKVRRGTKRLAWEEKKKSSFVLARIDQREVALLSASHWTIASVLS